MNQGYILRFNVSVQNLMTMHKVDSFKQIANYVARAFLSQCLATWNYIVKLSIAAELHDDIEILLITEIPIILDDIWMIEETLYFEFTNELYQKVIFDDTLFVHRFEGHDHTRVYLFGKEYTAELALSESHYNFKVFLAELPSFLW